MPTKGDWLRRSAVGIGAVLALIGCQMSPASRCASELSDLRRVSSLNGENVIAILEVTPAPGARLESGTYRLIRVVDGADHSLARLGVVVWEMDQDQQPVTGPGLSVGVPMNRAPTFYLAALVYQDEPGRLVLSNYRICND